ncbi:MAG: hypothetical protein KatS3mg124_1527 [Porticoccaceae bacterium]|nr:MAG: hypothetical protein KatS3mg124_1527 [Porticoccaceae bacterium]
MLHLPTLLSSTALVCLTLGVAALWVERRAHAGEGLDLVGGALLALAATHAVYLVGGGATPPRPWAAVAGNGLFSASLALLLAGVQAFQEERHRPLPRAWLWAPPPAAALIAALPLAAEPWRGLALSLLGAVQAACLIAQVAGPLRRGEGEQGRRLLLAASVLLLGLFALRAGLALGGASAQRAEWLAVTFLGASVFATLSAVGFLAMEMEWALARLREEAAHDPLTGLANRRTLVETLVREVARARRSGSSLAILLIDLDHFKAVNDRFGHRVGDRVLKEVAERIRARLRGQDLLARYGGEEFVAVLPDTDLAGAETVAEAIRRALADAPLQVRGLRVTASLGVAAAPGEAPDPAGERLLAAADRALYAAKRAGRNRVVCWTEPLPNPESPDQAQQI